MEHVILVNEHDEAIGTMEKLEAHEKSLLHRAFSVFIFNHNNELLLQQRNPLKYHSGGLWTNTCCGHPRPLETVENAAERRLFEEMGIRVSLQKKFSFIYKNAFENGLTEYEFDHVFFGFYNGKIYPNPAEVAAYTFDTLANIRLDMALHPSKYTAWFKICIDQVIENSKVYAK